MATFAFEVQWTNMNIFQKETNKWTNPIKSFKPHMTGGINQ